MSEISEFSMNMVPPVRARAIKTLCMLVYFDGVCKRRADKIAELVNEGRKVEFSRSGERRLIHPDGRFFNEKDLTKTGMDFAEYLINKAA